MTNTKIKVTLLISKNNSILLIKEWSDNKSGYYWNIIKGSYGDKTGETILECAKREAKEEAGINVEVSGFISCYVFHKAGKLNIQYNFLGKPLSNSNALMPPKEEQNTRDEDIQEIRWFSREELSKLKSECFISNRAYLVVRSWLGDKTYPLDIFQQLSEWN